MSPAVVMVLVDGGCTITWEAAQVLARSGVPRALCLVHPFAEGGDEWSVMVERDVRMVVSGARGCGDDLVIRWLPEDPTAARALWHEALDELSLPAMRDTPAVTEGRLVVRACGCVVSTNVRLADGVLDDAISDRAAVIAGTALRTDAPPVRGLPPGDGPWIYLHPDDVRGLRIARGTTHGCCGYTPRAEPTMRCVAHRELFGWASTECMLPWYVALRACDVTFTVLCDPDTAAPLDDEMWDGVG